MARKLTLIIMLAVLSACGVKKIAIKTLGNALADSGTSFSSDDDPELIEAALPFSLKLIESLLVESPRHRGLLFAAASGFTQYAFAFVQQDADEMEAVDLDRARELQKRARRMYLRARNYGLRGLEVKHPGFETALRANAAPTVALTSRKDVPLLYWTAVSWAAAISLSKDEPETVADQPLLEALIDRALELDETFDDGAIHAFLVTYEASRIGAVGDPAERCRKHFQRALELDGGASAGLYVSLAEAVSLESQDRPEFESLLAKALQVDPDARPESRLSNLVMQRRARWLLARADDLFLE